MKKPSSLPNPVLHFGSDTAKRLTNTTPTVQKLGPKPDNNSAKSAVSEEVKIVDVEVLKNQDPVKEINDRHARMDELAKDALQNAIRIGQLLTEQRKKCKHGEWLLWLEANGKFSRQTADNYLRLYRNKSKLLTVGNLAEAYRLTLPKPNTKKEKTPKTFLSIKLFGDREVTFPNVPASWQPIRKANALTNETTILCKKCWTYFTHAMETNPLKSVALQCECKDSKRTAPLD
jgi:hypothetical protein